MLLRVRAGGDAEAWPSDAFWTGLAAVVVALVLVAVLLVVIAVVAFKVISRTFGGEGGEQRIIAFAVKRLRKEAAKNGWRVSEDDTHAARLLDERRNHPLPGVEPEPPVAKALVALTGAHRGRRFWAGAFEAADEEDGDLVVWFDLPATKPALDVRERDDWEPDGEEPREDADPREDGLLTGNADFDARFLVRAADPDHARAALTPEVIAHLLASRSLAGFWVRGRMVGMDVPFGFSFRGIALASLNKAVDLVELIPDRALR
ncbi:MULTISPECIES: DUF3137 domain-containing protein [Actinosynnema]|uniref:DUF3137 domain-containing protein n=1 Tax=Actinosynnema TaxID=40566 RepID=UPI0020A35B2E|nr:DUF3137 domain-containing protein [Actinosynnema pretiosum]MCP2092353.1 hypothetical protein [Actinosynnema pretiosum]